MKRLIYVFKAVFGQDNDRSKKALILLLNTILDRKDDPITRVRILNPIIIGQSDVSKEGIMDIMAETQNGLILDIEAQSGHFKEYSNRALRYANALLEKALKRGDPYDTMEKSIVVTIADGKPYKAAGRLHCIFDIREREAGVPMTDRLEFHCIQLGFVDETKPVSELSPLELVAAYLKYAADEDKAGYTSELLEYGEGVIDMAENIFRDVTLDERAWVEKRSRELAEHTRASEIYQAREEGIEQGRTEGIAEGEASGRAAEKIEMARIMKDKDYSIAEISELTGLSVEEIEKL
jgi:predicted transposase/invertase (TIGR01784 family)